MVSPRRFLVFRLGLLLITAVWIAFTRSTPGSTTAGDPPVARTGFHAPGFALPTLAGEAVNLADFRGQVVVLNLWASWCPPCRAEMPAFQRVYDDYRSKGVVILAVNLTTQDSLTAAQEFVTEKGLTFPVLLDVEGSVGRAYQTSALPTTFFIGTDGIIRETIVGGPIAEAMVRAQVERLLSEVR